MSCSHFLLEVIIYPVSFRFALLSTFLVSSLYSVCHISTLLFVVLFYFVSIIVTVNLLLQVVNRWRGECDRILELSSLCYVLAPPLFKMYIYR